LKGLTLNTTLAQCLQEIVQKTIADKLLHEISQMMAKKLT
jgi:hypothetical protein